MAGIAPVTDNTVSGACVAAFLFVERPCASATRTPTCTAYYYLCRRADMQQSDSRIPFASSLNTRWYERIRPPPRTVASVRRRPATGHGLGRSPHIHHPSSNIDSRTEFRDRHVPLPTAPMCPKRGQHASRGAARDRTVCEHRAQQTRPGRRADERRTRRGGRL
jgi:hypothetical protein